MRVPQEDEEEEKEEEKESDRSTVVLEDGIGDYIVHYMLRQLLQFEWCNGAHFIAFPYIPLNYCLDIV